MSGFTDISYSQNVMVVDDVSIPARKKTKAWAAKEFIDRPVEQYIQTRNKLISQPAT
jgi:hypothetical protein